jgi:hypothetical protein
MEQLPASLSASEFQGAGRQAEAKVFTIMCASLSLSLSSWEEEGAVKRRGGEFLNRKFLMPVVS